MNSDPPAAGRHVRHGHVHPLARLGGRDGRARARRQRVRRGGGGRLRAAGRRAAPQRSRRRGADHLRAGRTTTPRPSCVDRVRRRPGRPSRTTETSGSSSSRAPVRWPPRFPGAVEAWLTLLRDHGTRRLADVLRYADRLRRARPPAAAPCGRRRSAGCGAVHAGLDDVGRGLPARRHAARAGCAAAQPGPRPHLPAVWSRRRPPPPADREARHRRGAAGLA